jgi:hypothetical protein
VSSVLYEAGCSAEKMQRAARSEADSRFEHYWSLFGKQSSNLFNECKITPSEECFHEMLRAAYMMGWTESEIAREATT